MRRFCLFAMATLTSLAVAHGATLLAENFDELTPQLSVTSAGAFTAINGTNVDIVGGALFGSLCAAPESGNCVDMDGSSGNPEGVIQSASITLVPGTNYFLSYDLVGSGRGNTASTTVTFGPYSHTVTLASGDTTSGIVTNALVTVSTSTTTNLTFSSNTPGFNGDMLDNVTVTSAAATPEPSTEVLIGVSLAGLWLLRSRRLQLARSRA